MEIIQERLDREFDMDGSPVPNVSHRIYNKNGDMQEVHNPADCLMPISLIEKNELHIRASVITTTNFIGSIMTSFRKTGELVKQEYISGDRVEIIYDIPLGEIVIDFMID
ncbi:hypothetical protein MASR1M31_12570 [Porphyromonadaceae bacterium]